MRILSKEEACNVSGGEAECTVSIGTSTGVSCTGSVGELAMVAAQVYGFLAASPFTIPGIIVRIS